MKRLKNTGSKYKDQLDAVKDQGEKQLNAIKDQGMNQLDAIKRQREDKPKIIEKDKIVYLENEINELFKIYRKSFKKQSKTSLKSLAKNEVNISYNNLSYKIFLLDGTFHGTSFLK